MGSFSSHSFHFFPPSIVFRYRKIQLKFLKENSDNVGSYVSRSWFYSQMKVISRELEFPYWLHPAPTPNVISPEGLTSSSLGHTLWLSPALLPLVTLMHARRLFSLLKWTGRASEQMTANQARAKCICGQSQRALKGSIKTGQRQRKTTFLLWRIYSQF